VSSGCIRLTNPDIIDLYGRARLGGKVVRVGRVGRAEGAAQSTRSRRPSSVDRLSVNLRARPDD
jgi:hypothetical protein